jgi:hypothetical protein
MARYVIFGRHAYAEPLEQVGDVELAGDLTVDAAGLGDDWLELVLIPAEEIIWIERDGELVRAHAEVRA